MRTRTTATISPAYTKDYVTTWIPGVRVLDPEGYNPQWILPLKPEPGTSFVDSDGTALLPASARITSSVISDEIGSARPIRPCSHVTRVPVIYPSVVYARTGSWSQTRYILPGEDASTLIVPFTYELGTGYLPAAKAWGSLDLSSTSLNVDIQSVTEASIPGTPPPDRLAELPSKVVERIQSLQLGVTFGELREFPQLLKLITIRGAFGRGDTWVQLLSKRHAFKNLGRKAKIKELLTAYRNGHLGLAFGLLPTVRDVLAIYNEVRHPKKLPKRNFTVTIKGSKVKHHAASTGTHNGLYRADHIVTTTHKRVDGVRVTHSPSVYLTDAFKWLDGYATLLKRYAGQNPLGIIWELFPLSFCVDWLLSVDKVIDSIWLRNQTEFKCEYWSSTTTQFYRQMHWSYRKEFTTSGYPAMNSSYVGGPMCFETFKAYNRTPRGAPNPLQSVRIGGATPSNVYLAILIALGLRR